MKLRPGAAAERWGVEQSAERYSPVMRGLIFFVGFALFVIGAVSNFKSIPLPFDCKSITCSISTTAFTLDVVLMTVGVFLILIAWLIKRLGQ